MRIFAIGSDTLHLYGTVKALRGAASMPPPGAVEFYDVRGSRLAPVYGRGWKLTDLVPVGRRDSRKVKREIVAVLGSLRAHVEARAAEVVAAPAGEEVDAAEALALKERNGLDLDKWFDVLERARFGHLSDEDRQNWWHNLVAHGIRG